MYYIKNKNVMLIKKFTIININGRDKYLYEVLSIWQKESDTIKRKSYIILTKMRQVLFCFLHVSSK